MSKEQDKVALITGASRGIGKAIAIRLAKDGYNVILNFATSKLLASQLAEYIEGRFPVRAATICANVGVEADVQIMIDQIMREFGRIDVLVNNAGVQINKPFSEKTLQDVHKTFSTNFEGAYLLTKYAAPIMARQKGGKIINISSNNAKPNNPSAFDYTASKAALNSFTRNMAKEFAPYVNVNAVAPGYIDTSSDDPLSPDNKKPDAATLALHLSILDIAKNRTGKPEEVAALVSFLASKDAEYINGTVIEIDGGM